jgi:hypothetical protein
MVKRPAPGPAIARNLVRHGGPSRQSIKIHDYPEVNCGGKLTRLGASHSYTFFVEVITRGRTDKGGRCPDGTITVAPAGDNLGWAWFGVPQGDVIVAFGTLTRKPAR